MDQESDQSEQGQGSDQSEQGQGSDQSEQGQGSGSGEGTGDEGNICQIGRKRCDGNVED